MNHIDYQADFYAWTQQQAKLLRNKEIEQIDWCNVAEEIEVSNINSGDRFFNR